jgi:pimeloyl-ACP methyl ester carboxylesterase
MSPSGDAAKVLGRPRQNKEIAMESAATSLITTQMRTVDGLSIRYAESDVDRDQDALLLSPWPESLYCFEPMWEHLTEHAHLVAVDLPGFGHSEGRDDLFNSRGMGEFVLKLADAFDLEQPHAVGPDIGTSALLFAASRNGTRLRSLTIGGGGAAVPLQLGVELKQIVDAPTLADLPPVPPRQAINAVLNYHERHKLPDYVREDYLSGYDGERFVPSLAFVRAYPTELPILSELLPQIRTPVAILQGAHDPGVLPVNAQYLRDRLPNSKVTLLDAGHFAWADRADDYAALLISWWNGGYQNP